MTATATEHPVTSPRRRVLLIIVLLVAYAVLVFFVLSALFAGATTVGKSAVTKAGAATSAKSVSATYLAAAAPPALAMEQSATVAAAVAAQVGAGSLPTSAALSSLDQLPPLLQQDQRALQAIKAPSADAKIQQSAVNAGARLIQDVTTLRGAVSSGNKPGIGRAAASLDTDSADLANPFLTKPAH